MKQLINILVIISNLLVLTLSEQSRYPVTTYIYEGSKENCKNACVRKCCNYNYILNGTDCVYRDLNEFQVTLYDKNESLPKDSASTYSIVSGLMSCPKDEQYRLSPKEYQDDTFYVQNDGRLWQPFTNTFIDYDHYCLEYFEDIHMSALVCLSKGGKIGKGLNAIGMIISMPFLLATFLVYALIPERNLHKTYLMCYVFALFCAYFVLVFVHVRAQYMTVTSCTIMGISCLYFFLASFFWTNVISLDIWWTFSGARGLSDKNSYHKNRILLYSGYAWGSPLLMVLLVITVSYCASPNKWYNPGIGDGHCWFQNKLAELFYFYGPIAILIITNVVLFGRTYWEIRNVQKASLSIRKHVGKKKNFEEDKQKFNLYLKLLLAMGINWSMEVISWLVDWQTNSVPDAVWYLTDFCNALYGVFIFFIFVFKQSVLNSLKRRYFMITGKLHKARSLLRRSDTPATTETSL